MLEELGCLAVETAATQRKARLRGLAKSTLSIISLIQSLVMVTAKAWTPVEWLGGEFTHTLLQRAGGAKVRQMPVTL